MSKSLFGALGLKKGAGLLSRTPSLDAGAKDGSEAARTRSGSTESDEREAAGLRVVRQAIKNLNKAKRQSDRITALKTLKGHVDQMSEAEIVAAWTGARELLVSGSAGSGVIALCYEFIADGMTEGRVYSPIDRFMFFQDIRRLGPTECLGPRVSALSSLAAGGRDITPFQDSVLDLLVAWMQALFHATSSGGEQHAVIGNWMTASKDDSRQSLEKIYGLLVNIAKFQPHLLAEANVSSMVKCLVSICRRSTSELDILGCLAIFDSIHRYGNIPADACQSIVEVLCSAILGNGDFKHDALSLMRNFINSHVSMITVFALRKVLEARESNRIMVVRGAISVIKRLMFDEAWASPGGLNRTFYVTTIQNAIYLRNSQVNMEICNVLNSLFQSSDVTIPECAVSLPLLKEIADTVFQAAAQGSDAEGMLKTSISSCTSELYKMALRPEFANISGMLAHFFQSVNSFCSDDILGFVFDYYEGLEYMAVPMEEISDCIHFAKCCLNEWQSSSAVRLRALALLSNTADIATDLGLEVSNELQGDMLQTLAKEDDLIVLEKVLDWIIAAFKTADTFEKRNKIANIICDRLMKSQLLADQNTAAWVAPLLGALLQMILDRFRASDVKTFDMFIQQISRLLLPSSTTVATIVKQVLLLLSLQFRCDADDSLVILQQQSSRSKYTWSEPFERPLGTDQTSLSATSTVSDDDDHGPGRILYQYLAGFTETRSIQQERGFKSIKVDVLRPLIRGWVEIVGTESNWHTVRVVISRLSDSLCCKPLFRQYTAEFSELRSVVCDALASGVPQLELPNHLRKADVVTAYAEILISLIAYGDSMTKQQQDELVAAIFKSMQKWHTTTRLCIHGLYMACLSMPLSVTKVLPATLVRLSQLITSQNLGLHILEFLEALARFPSVFSNFTEAEYKQVFGIALKSIQHYNLACANEANELAIGKDVFSTKDSVMSKYLLMLAFNVLATWFLETRLAERRKFVPWIIRGLVLANQAGQTAREHCETFFDLMVRFTYSNLMNELRTAPSQFDPQQSSIEHWIRGNAILAVRTVHSTGSSEVLVRRPTGTLSFTCQLNSSLDDGSIRSVLEMANNFNSQSSLFTAGYLALQSFFLPDVNTSVHPCLLQSTPALQRALGVLDRIPVVDLHKIGVVYVKPGQTQERDILANRSGSRAYSEMLDGLGLITALKGNQTIFTGGLDIEQDLDGEFAYYWRNSITQVIYHVATMMPTSLETDPLCTMKKRHLGNDFVTIVFNDSGQEYGFDTISGQFNYVNVVVSPCYEGPARLGRANTSSGPSADTEFLRVEIQRKPSLPEFSPVFTPRVVSLKVLPLFLRLLALNASVLAMIHKQGGSEYNGTWVERLRQIEQLRERVGGKHLSAFRAGGGSNGTSGAMASTNGSVSDTTSVMSADEASDAGAHNIEMYMDFTKYI